MWPPVDITAVPTGKELFEAKIAIEQVESELEQARLRVANIEKDLEARRAWIAPVRRLPYDVLSLIFELCGEDNWRTPLRISGVSRLWRTVALTTPRAWAFLPVYEHEGEDDDLIRHFFQHSRQRPLHVFLREYQHLAILPEVAEKLECLSVYERSQLEEIPVFPQLKRLSLRSVDEYIGVSDLCIARLPALRELICEAAITVSLLKSMKMTFPPLQILSINIEENTAWLDLLLGVRSSLVSLRLHVVDNCPAPQLEVLLPVLRCLEIHLWDDYPDIWPMDMKTPAIETYIQGTQWAAPPSGTTPIHRNFGNISGIRISYVPNLVGMPFLRTLQLGIGVPITDVLSQLQSDRSLSPRLELVELMQAADLAPYETSLVEVNRERSPPISIRNVETWATGLPYEISLSSCGPDMPCSGEYT